MILKIHTIALVFFSPGIGLVKVKSLPSLVIMNSILASLKLNRALPLILRIQRCQKLLA